MVTFRKFLALMTLNNTFPFTKVSPPFSHPFKNFYRYMSCFLSLSLLSSACLNFSTSLNIQDAVLITEQKTYYCESIFSEHKFRHLLIYLFSVVHNFLYERSNDATNYFVIQEIKIVFQFGQSIFYMVSTRAKSK